MVIEQTTTDELVDVVLLFVEDKPKGLMTESQIVNFSGRVWWDYIERYSISRTDYENRNLSDIYWKYHKR